MSRNPASAAKTLHPCRAQASANDSQARRRPQRSDVLPPEQALALRTSLAARGGTVAADNWTERHENRLALRASIEALCAAATLPEHALRDLMLERQVQVVAYTEARYFSYFDVDAGELGRLKVHLVGTYRVFGGDTSSFKDIVHLLVNGRLVELVHHQRCCIASSTQLCIDNQDVYSALPHQPMAAATALWEIFFPDRGDRVLTLLHRGRLMVEQDQLQRYTVSHALDDRLWRVPISLGTDNLLR